MKSQHHAFVFVLAAALSACSKEEAAPSGASGGASAAETPAAPSASTPATESAAQAPAPIDTASPVGAWTLDANASLDFNVAALMARAESITPEQEKQMRDAVAMVVAMLQMELTLAADNTLTGTNTAPPIGGTAATPTAMTGTWALDGDVLTVTTRDVGAVETVALTGRLDGAQLVLRMDDGAAPLTLIFVRKS
jgi:hypothetical protein